MTKNAIYKNFGKQLYMYPFFPDSVMVNSAKVLTADVPTVNGVIHIIDNVLIPKK